MARNLMFGAALVSALALGACSGNNASGTTGGQAGTGAGAGGSDGTGGNSGTDANGDGNGDGGDANGGPEPTALDMANEQYSAADAAVKAVIAAAEGANTETARAEARRLIGLARRALDAAVKAADAAVAEAAGGSATDIGAAQRALNRANDLLRDRTITFDDERDSYAWYGRDLVRWTFASRAVEVPREGGNTAKIERIARTVDDGNGNQIANDKAFTSTTFKDVMYADGKKVFSVADDANGGDEFKVDGYVSTNVANFGVRPFVYTGLKLTEDGIVIRTGGTTATSNIFDSDYTDMRRDITKWANVSVSDLSRGVINWNSVVISTSPQGQNGWDLEITFDEPQTRSVANRDTSWAGNGDFYWKSLVLPDPSQLKTDGDYYNSLAFRQLDGYKDLGTYEIWLSNHIGTDMNLEPAPGSGVVTCPDGSRGFSCPYDDEVLYLEYAAYGLFLYTADTDTYRQSGPIGWNGWNGHVGRINTLHFGYLAFADDDGKRITDIGEAITGGIFKGYTLVHEVRHDQNLEEGITSPVISKLLRGDVTLTVNIPKGSGAATLEGRMNNFQSWSEEFKRWIAYIDDFRVALNRATINADGTFNGAIAATPAASFRNAGSGTFKGSFYGPRSDAVDLEIAGSWTNLATNGGTENDRRGLFGSFGAKQVTPTSN